MDLVIRNARRPHESEPVDIGVKNGKIEAVEPRIDGAGAEEIDANGYLVSPPFVESHFHLDTVFCRGTPRRNQTGSLIEGIMLWSETQPLFTIEGVKDRAIEYLKWCVARGTLYLRSHVDVCHDSLVAVRALVEARDEVAPWIDVQLVAFPQHGLLRYPDGVRLLDEALDLGCEVIGGIPHYERSREAGVASIDAVMDRASRKGLIVDMHCDETDDPLSRFVEVVAEQTVERGLEGQITTSHLTSLHSVDNAYFFKVAHLIREAGLNVVSNPLTNMMIQARTDTYPKRRGLTRVKELMESGVNLSFGHDCLLDHWYPLGAGDMLDAAYVGLHACQMGGVDEIAAMFDAVTVNGAKTLGLDGYGLEPGCSADLVILQARGVEDALRLRPPRLKVLRKGRVVAQTPETSTEVVWGEIPAPVDFEQPAFV